MSSPEELRQLVIAQNNARLGWTQHDTPDNMMAMIREENAELLDAVEQDMPAYPIASEIGDIAYLCIRYEHNYGHLDDEARYILFWAEKLAEQVGLNVFDCLHLKIVRNDMKYPASIVNSMPYKEARHTCKQLWATAGGDAAFYEWYLTIFGAQNGEGELEQTTT